LISVCLLVIMFLSVSYASASGIDMVTSSSLTLPRSSQSFNTGDRITFSGYGNWAHMYFRLVALSTTNKPRVQGTSISSNEGTYKSLCGFGWTYNSNPSRCGSSGGSFLGLSPRPTEYYIGSGSCSGCYDVVDFAKLGKSCTVTFGISSTSHSDKNFDVLLGTVNGVLSTSKAILFHL